MQATGTASNLIWSPADKPVSVHLNPDVARRVRPPHLANGTRVPECGGILLGYARETGDKWLIAVDDALELPGREPHDDSWSPDRDRLIHTLRRADRAGGLQVVGFWRTHTRSGLYLDQTDFRLMREYFASPSQVAMLVSPDAGGFFFWENGDIQRSHAYETFPIEDDPATAHVPVVRAEPWRPRKAWLAVPVVAGIALGFLWNPDPLQRRSRSVELSELPDRDTGSEPRAVFAPPPLPESEATTPYIPPSEGDPQVTRSRTEPTEQPRLVRRSLVPPPPRITAAEPSLDADAPQIAAVRTERPMIPHAQEQLVQAVMEPSKPSAVRRVVGSIPGFGFLKRRKAAGEPENYIPPKIVRQIRPTSPAGLTEEVPVRVRVLLSSAGKIEKTELLTRKVEPAVAKAAVEAAQNWRFEPARLDEKPVASELVLQFRFPAATAGGGT